MLAGTGQCELLFPEHIPRSESEPFEKRPHYVRVLIAGRKNPFVLCSIEMDILPETEIDLLRHLIAARAQTVPDRVWITVIPALGTHRILPDEHLDSPLAHSQRKELQVLLRDTVHTAVLKARTAMANVPVSFHSDDRPDSIVQSSHRQIGTEPVPQDLIRIGGDLPSALIVHFPVLISEVDSNSRHSQNRLVCEAASIAASRIETLYPGTAVFFLFGADVPSQVSHHGTESEQFFSPQDARNAADQFEIHLSQQISHLLDLPGVPLGNELTILNTRVQCKTRHFTSASQFYDKGKITYRADGECTETVSVLAWDPLSLAAFRPEITGKTVQVLQSQSPFTHTWAAVSINGWSGCMPSLDAYDLGLSEALYSQYMPSSAEHLATAALSALNAVRDQSPECEIIR